MGGFLKNYIVGIFLKKVVPPILLWYLFEEGLLTLYCIMDVFLKIFVLTLKFILGLSKFVLLLLEFKVQKSARNALNSTFLNKTIS